MITEPTAEQIKTYRETGFVAIPGMFLNELEAWRRATDESIAERLGSKGGLTNQGAENNVAPANDYYAKVFTQALRLADSHEGMRKLIYDPRIGRFACMLEGIDAIRVWHDQALVKPPYGNPTAWHLDNPYWSFSSEHSISIWIALDDATLENGCMWYVPGSHKQAKHAKNSGIGMNMVDLFNMYPEFTRVDPVSVPAKAGTAVFHNGLTAHGAGANMTRRQRRAMTCAFMPDGSTFNGTRNILPEELFKSLKVGDVIADEKWTPLIWKQGMAV